MKQIVEYFKKCPAMSGRTLREDYFAPESGSAAIMPDGGEKVLKQYTSGDMLGQYKFKLLLRENFVGKAGNFFDQLSEWIAGGSQNLPELGANKTTQYIEVTEGPALIKTEVGAGVYEMKFRLVYYRKGVTE